MCTEIILADYSLSTSATNYRPTVAANIIESKNIAGEVVRRILFINAQISILIVIIDAAGKMSTADEDDKIKVQRCASCGIAGIDDVKLKDCSACHLVRYCGVKCQKDHWPRHKKECKKRAAELRDEILFKQPECNQFGDCPICCLPIPIDMKKSTLNSCCCQRICIGCSHANKKREYEGRLQHKCPFCRKATPSTKEEAIELLMKRVEANDPVAILEIGTDIHDAGDYKSGFEYWTKAAALGVVEAHYQLSGVYQFGRGVEKDKKKELHHLSEAAIAGHPLARHNLGCLEWENGRMDRAAKHYIISANLGYDDSLKSVKDLYKAGYVSKEDFAAALRGHHAAVDATKSPQREEAYDFLGI